MDNDYLFYNLQGSVAARQPRVSFSEIVKKFSWMSKPVPKQTLHLFELFMHTSEFQFEAYARLPSPDNAIYSYSVPYIIFIF